MDDAYTHETYLDELVENAQAGDPDSQNTLAYLLEVGEDFEEDPVAAVGWYRAAADAGHGEAQANLGSCYERGVGVEADIKEAIYWYGLSAGGGDAIGQYSLGNCYKWGSGVGRDMEIAARWHEAAARQGYVLSQNILGELYRDGMGVPQNLEMAAYWFDAAAERGFLPSEEEFLKLVREHPELDNGRSVKYTAGAGGDAAVDVAVVHDSARDAAVVREGYADAGDDDEAGGDDEADDDGIVAVFARWPADGFYYPGYVGGQDGTLLDILYMDGESRRVDTEDTLDFWSAIENMNMQCNYQHRGYYYPCRLIRSKKEGKLRVRYDEDGIKEYIEYDQIRLSF